MTSATNHSDVTYPHTRLCQTLLKSQHANEIINTDMKKCGRRRSIV